MCSHYQTLKDAELLLKKFGVREKPVALGWKINHKGECPAVSLNEWIQVRFNDGCVASHQPFHIWDTRRGDHDLFVELCPVMSAQPLVNSAKEPDPAGVATQGPEVGSW